MQSLTCNTSFFNLPGSREGTHHMRKRGRGSVWQILQQTKIIGLFHWDPKISAHFILWELSMNSNIPIWCKLKPGNNPKRFLTKVYGKNVVSTFSVWFEPKKHRIGKNSHSKISDLYSRLSIRWVSTGFNLFLRKVSLRTCFQEDASDLLICWIVTWRISYQR